MAQGLRKIPAGTKKAHVGPKKAIVRKGRRVIKSNNGEINNALAPKKELTKAINSNIEQELASHAGAKPFKIVKPGQVGKKKTIITTGQCVVVVVPFLTPSYR